MFNHEFQGKNIFTKLGDVIELKKKDTISYASSNSSRNQAIKAGSILIIQNQIINKKEEKVKADIKNINPKTKAEKKKKNKSATDSPLKNKLRPNKLSILEKNSMVVENSQEDKFLTLVKNSLIKNSNLLGNPERYIKQIDRNITRLPNVIIESNDLDFIEEEMPPHKLKQKLEENEMAKKINDIIKRSKENLEENDEKFNQINDSNKSNQSKKDVQIKPINPLLMKKFEKSIIGGLVNIYQNKLTLKDVLEKRLIPNRPYSLPGSFDFFDAVKFENIPKVESFLIKDKRFLFEYDYFHQTAFHWAAKRGNNQMLSALLDYGSNINILDNEYRTPLWLAAKNNYFITCDMLLQKEANPFLLSKEGKKAIDVTYDGSIKKLLTEYMEKHSYMKSHNYFKSKVVENIKDEFVLRKKIMALFTSENPNKTHLQKSFEAEDAEEL